MTSDETAKSFSDDTLHLDFDRSEVAIHGRPVDLPRLQYVILSTLVCQQGHVVSLRELTTLMWGGDDPPPGAAAKAITSHIAFLRKKLDPGWRSGGYSPIETVPGFGYRYRSLP